MADKARVYGLIGYPVKHSLSPAMHNAAFKALGINAHYELFEVKPQDLKSFLDSLKDNEIHGLNVTIPHKEQVLDFVELDKESIYARQINAVNTITRRGDVFIAFNTDIPGFSQDLKQKFDPAEKKVAILGAGGAGKAVACAIAQSKAQQIVIFDIDTNKANSTVDLVKKLSNDIDIKSVESIEKLDILNKDLLINATPVGMKESDPCLVAKEMLHKNLFVYDVIFIKTEIAHTVISPFLTAFLKVL